MPRLESVLLLADERMNPVFDYQLNECGAVYINVGDGGNIGANLHHLQRSLAALSLSCQPSTVTGL